MFGKKFKIEVFYKIKPGEIYPKVIRPYGIYYQKNGTLVIVGDTQKNSTLRIKADLKEINTISINSED